MTLDRALANKIHAEIIAAAKEIAAKHRMFITKKGGNFGDFDLKVSMTLQMISEEAQEAKENKKEALWVLYAPSFGLKPEWFGKTFNCQNKTFEIIDLQHRKHKFPVICNCKEDGKEYKFGPETVIRYMK